MWQLNQSNGKSGKKNPIKEKNCSLAKSQKLILFL